MYSSLVVNSAMIDFLLLIQMIYLPNNLDTYLLVYHMWLRLLAQTGSTKPYTFIFLLVSGFPL